MRIGQNCGFFESVPFFPSDFTIYTPNLTIEIKLSLLQYKGRNFKERMTNKEKKGQTNNVPRSCPQT